MFEDLKFCGLLVLLRQSTLYETEQIHKSFAGEHNFLSKNIASGFSVSFAEQQNIRIRVNKEFSFGEHLDHKSTSIFYL